MRTKRLTINVAEALMIRDMIGSGLAHPLISFECKSEEMAARRLHKKVSALIFDALKAAGKI